MEERNKQRVTKEIDLKTRRKKTMENIREILIIDSYSFVLHFLIFVFVQIWRKKGFEP